MASGAATSPPTAEQASGPSTVAEFHSEEVPGIISMMTPEQRQHFETDPASFPDADWNQAVLNYRGAMQGAEQ